MGSNQSIEKEISKYRRCEIFYFSIGIFIFISSAFYYSRNHDSPNAWPLVGGFIPLASAISLIAFWLSVTTQRALKNRGAPSPILDRKKCLNYLVNSNDREGIQLLNKIAMAANAYAFAFGISIGMCLYIAIRS